MASRWKRDGLNVRNVVDFFLKEKGFNPFDFVTPDEFLKVAQLCEKHPAVMDHIVAYARRYKQATRELTPELVDEARNLIAVTKVMES